MKENKAKYIKRAVHNVIKKTETAMWTNRHVLLRGGNEIKRGGKKAHSRKEKRKRWQTAALIKRLRTDPAIRKLLRDAVKDELTKIKVGRLSLRFQSVQKQRRYSALFSYPGPWIVA